MAAIAVLALIVIVVRYNIKLSEPVDHAVCLAAWGDMSPYQRHMENLSRKAFLEKCYKVEYAVKCNDGFIAIGEADLCKNHAGDKAYYKVSDG